MNFKLSRLSLLVGLLFSAGAMFPGMAGAQQAAAVEQKAESKAEEEVPKDLLSNFELGEKHRAAKSYEESRKAWLRADEYVRAWEDEAKNSPEKLLQSVGEGLGSVLINDTVRRFDGADYERVALASKLALAHLALSDWEKARIEIRKLHERESVISEFRAKEVETIKAEREEKQVEEKSMTDLKGYPVELLDIPEVTSLRNSYQSAFGHYLAGFMYEQAGDGSLAAAGYRQAIELRPDLTALQDSLAGLDKRLGKPSHKATDTLIVVEAGMVPKKTSTTIPLPVPTHNGLVIVPTSFPSMTPPVDNPIPATISINGKPIDAITVTSYDAMARRELKDSMPGVIARGTIRAIAKGVINSEIQKRAGFFGGLISSIITTATETADTRMWTSLPSHVAIARVPLAPGKHTVDIAGVSSEIEVMGAYSLVAMRHQPGNLQLAVATTPMVPEPPPAIALAEEQAPKDSKPTKADSKKAASKKSPGKEKAK